MKKQSKISMNWLIMFSLIVVSLFTFSCEESDEDVTKEEEQSSTTVEVGKNTVIVGETTETLDIYTYNSASDINANGKTYLNIIAWKGTISTSTPSISLFLNTIPSSSKTLDWQTSSYAFGDLTTSEFVVQLHDGNKRWFGEYSTTAYNTSGSMDVKIEGGVATFSFADIELGDSFLAGQSTETKKCSGSFSVTLSEIDLTSERGGQGNLVD